MPHLFLTGHPKPQAGEGLVCPVNRTLLILWLVFLTLLCQIPLLSPQFMPTHDNMNRFAMFYPLYSHLTLQGELPLWLPHVNYGVTYFYMQFNSLSPSLALMAGLGWLFNVDNVLILFKLSMVVDALFFTFSMLLLVEELLPESRLARCLVLVGSILTSSWMEQPYLNFYVYYALPLVIFLLVRFIRRKESGYFWAAALVELMSFMGNVAYFAPLHFWGLLLLFLPTLYKQPSLLRALFGKGSLLMFCGLALVAGTLAYFAIHSLDYLTLLSYGRDAADGQVSPRHFLNYGRGSLANMASGLLTGGFLHFDNTYYMGLLPLVLFFYGLLVYTHPLFVGFALFILLLVALSVGGATALMVYLYLPGMNLFRHVGMVYGLVKVLLLPAVGMLVQAMVTSTIAKRPSWLNVAMLLLVAAILLDGWWVWRPYDNQLVYEKSEFMRASWWIAPALRVLLYGLVVVWLWRDSKRLLPGLLLAFFVDVAIFQLQVVVTTPLASREIPASTFDRRPITFLAERQKKVDASS
ncbi:MAG: hypothetical protein G8345_18400, partial [Magnetococcales bacterium]|nr:hypothetical protein [Magnetococcales bacterium]NGZ28846.1 hypothetical protein [Magnetococcales bacterium]